MDITSPEIVKTIITQGIFAILFVWLLYDTRKEAKEREERLLQQLENNNTVYEKLVESINALREQIIKGGS